MKAYKNVFLDSLNTADLHELNRDEAVLKTKDFILENIKLKNKSFVLIHGIGSGILRKAVHEYLNNCKDVKTYKTDYFNQGATVVTLK